MKTKIIDKYKDKKKYTPNKNYKIQFIIIINKLTLIIHVF